MLQAYVEALAQTLRVPELRTQLAEHYRRARAMVAELVAVSMARSSGETVDPADPRCTAVASLVIAACDGLAMQWLLDPDGLPSAEDLAAGLAAVLDASVPDGTRVSAD
jgi:hypothetical protein